MSQDRQDQYFNITTKREQHSTKQRTKKHQKLSPKENCRLNKPLVHKNILSLPQDCSQ